MEKRAVRILAVLLGLLAAASFALAAGCGGGSGDAPAGTPVRDGEDAVEASGPGEGAGGRVLLVVAPQSLNDREYNATRGALEEAGYDVVAASTRTGEARGSEGTVVAVDLTLSQADPGDYEAVAFIGGTGAGALIDDDAALALARAAGQGGLIVAAICMAPAILANAGVLAGKRATAIPSVAGDLEAGGATYVDQDVVADGRILTGNGPAASEAFGAALVRMLQGD